MRTFTRLNGHKLGKIETFFIATYSEIFLYEDQIRFLWTSSNSRKSHPTKKNQNHGYEPHTILQKIYF